MSHIHAQRRLSVVLIVAMFISMVPTAAAPTRPIRELTAIESSHSVSYEFDPSAQVRVVAPVAPVLVGETFTVTVAAAQVDTPLSAFQFELSYDPLLLDFVHAAEGSFLSSTGRAAVCPTPAEGVGVVRLACASTGPMRGPTGEGALALLTFRARTDGESDLILATSNCPMTGVRPQHFPPLSNTVM